MRFADLISFLAVESRYLVPGMIIIATSKIAVCIFVNDVRPKRRKNNQVQRIVKRPAGVEREGRSEAEERPNEARRAARRGEIIAR